MRVTAKTDYAVRAAIEIAVAGGESRDAEQISSAQEIPVAFLVRILAELSDAGILTGEGGDEKTYGLARPASEITVAEIIDAVDGPLASVHSELPQDLSYSGSAEPLRDVWVAMNKSVTGVLGAVDLADLAGSRLPPEITNLVS